MDALSRLGCSPELALAGCEGEWEAMTLTVTVMSLVVNTLAAGVLVLSLLGSCLYPKVHALRNRSGRAHVVDTMELKHEDLAAVVDDIDAEGPSGSERPAREFIRTVLRRDSQGLLLGGATDALLVATDGQLAVREARGDSSGSVATGVTSGLKRKQSWMGSLFGSSATTMSGRARQQLRGLHDTDVLRLLLLGCVGCKAIRDALILAGVTVSSPFRVPVMLLWTAHGALGVSVLVVHLRHYSLVVSVSDPTADIESLLCRGKLATRAAVILMALLQYGLDVLSIVRTASAFSTAGRDEAAATFAYYTAASFYSWTSLCFVMWVAFTLLSRKLLDLINRSILLCKARKQEEVSVAMTMLDYDHDQLSTPTFAEGITVAGAASAAEDGKAARPPPVTMAELLRGMDDPVDVPRSSTYGAQSDTYASMIAASMRRGSTLSSSSPKGRVPLTASQQARAGALAASNRQGARLCCCCGNAKATVAPAEPTAPPPPEPTLSAPKAQPPVVPASAEGGRASAPAPSGAHKGRRVSAMERGVTKDVLKRVESQATMLGYRQATVREVLTALDSQLRALRRARKTVRTIMWTLGGFWGIIAAICLVMGTAQAAIRQSVLFSGIMHAGFNLAAGLLVLVLLNSLILRPVQVLVHKTHRAWCKKRPKVRRIGRPPPPPRVFSSRSPAEPPRPPAIKVTASRPSLAGSEAPDGKMPFKSVSSRRLGKIPSMPTLHE